MSAEGALTIQRELGFYEEEIPLGGLCVPGETLSSRERWLSVLELVGERLDLKDKPLRVAASQFTKWYCRAHCGVLYSMSAENRFLSASLQDVSILFPGDPPFAIGATRQPERVTFGRSREELRDDTLRNLFARNFAAVFSSLIEFTGVKQDILWENAAVYIHYYYRLWIEQELDPKVRSRLKDDYEYIVSHAPAALFGPQQTANPFLPTGGPMRNTCCLRYNLPDGRKCSTCPLN